MLINLERMMWVDQPESGPSGGGGGNDPHINPKLPVSIKKAIVLQMQQSQWYNTTVKVPVIVSSSHQENINVVVQGLQNEVYSVKVPVEAEQENDYGIKLPVRIVQEQSKTINQIVRHGSSNDISVKVPVKYFDNDEIKKKYAVQFADCSNNTIYAPVRGIENIEKDIVWKVRNLKLLDIIDLL